MPRRNLAVAVGVLSLAAAQATLAQLPAPVGSEFQTNSFTTGLQGAVDVALDADGDFVVVWRSDQDGSSSGIFGRRFASGGLALATEFQVNTRTSGYQGLPAVAMGAAGGFVVSWSSFNQDDPSAGVFARRFNSAGAGLGVEFQVNAYTTGSQTSPAVAAEADGDFVVVWSGSGTGDTSGVFARRFSSAGTPQAAEFRVNSTTGGAQYYAAVGMDADGDFVVAWQSPDVSGYGVFAQRFGSSGASVGPEFQANVHLTGNQDTPAVSLDFNGDFVVAWRSASQDAGTEGIFARRFDSAGTPTGTEFQANTYVTGYQRLPTIASDRDGDFVIAWGSNSQDGSDSGIFARRFKSPGIPTTGEIQINTYVTDRQFSAQVAADSDGDFVVAWTSNGQDGSGYGNFAQRFDVPMLIDVDGDGAYLPLTDGLLLLRFGFGFTGATLINGALGAGCTRCDGPSISSYLQSLL